MTGRVGLTRVTSDPLDPAEHYAAVQDPACAGLPCLFCDTRVSAA